MSLKLNTKYLESFINSDELTGIKTQVEAAAKTLHEKSGLGNLQARMGLAARSRGRKCPPVCPVSGKRVWMRPNSGGTTDRFDSP